MQHPSSSSAINIPSPPVFRTPAPVITPDEDHKDALFFSKASRRLAPRQSNELWSRSWSILFNKSTMLGEDNDDGDDEDNDHIDATTTTASVHEEHNGNSQRIIDEADGQEHNEQTPLITRKQPRQSNLIQSAFNSLNLLAGMGILTLPYTFRLTGWILGVASLLVFALIASHTAKLLGKCLDHPSCFGPGGLKGVSYGDVGEAAFGVHGRRFISVLFIAQMIAACVAYTILIGDSIEALFPHFNLTHIKLVTWAVLTPTTWPKSMRVLSYTSLIGIIALVNMVVIILYDGLTTPTSPGSITDPAITHLFPPNLKGLPIAIGLTMVGFDGHTVFPSIYRDLKSPQKFPWVVGIAYSLAVLLYITVATAGYLMFGNETLQEITQNLPTVPTFNPRITQYTIWLVAINPATKFALLIKPVIMNVEQHLYIWAPTLYNHQQFTRIISSTVLSLLIVLIAIFYPEFTNVMALLGSAFSFIIAIIFPTLCYLQLYGTEIYWLERWGYHCIVIFGSMFGVLGTIYSLKGL